MFRTCWSCWSSWFYWSSGVGYNKELIDNINDQINQLNTLLHELKTSQGFVPDENDPNTIKYNPAFKFMNEQYAKPLWDDLL